jgi:hypothetical protein
MSIPFQLAIQFHELIISLFVAFILFVGAVYITEKIKQRINEKPKQHGTTEVCGTCDALIQAKKVPVMEQKQDTIRSIDIPGITKAIGNLESTTKSLDERVKKLFTMIEEDWKGKIFHLEEKLREKDRIIEGLKAR